MALALYDRVQQTGTANTTISFTLSGSVTGFQSFAVVGNGNTTYYSATDQSGNWETGLGTYSTTGPTLTRTTVYQSSNSNAAVTFAGTVNVFVTYPAGRNISLDASGNATALGTPAAFVGTNITGTASGLSIGGNAATATSATSSPLVSALGNYVWLASTLPTSFNAGIQSSFVQAADGWQNYGSVITTRTYSGGGGSLQMYVPYSPTYGGTGMQVRFGNYDVSSGNSWTAWKTILASDNFNSYAPTLTGTGASGTWGISISGSAATAGSVANSLTINSPLMGTSYNGSSAVSIGIPAATTSASGYLTSTDWNTFNGKQAAGSYVTVGGALGTPSSGTLTNCTFPTLNQNTTGSSGSCTGNAATATTATTATTANATNTSNNFQMNSLGVGTAGSATAGEIRATNNVTAFYSSDRTLKENIQDIPNALEIVTSIGSKSFDWTDSHLEAHGGVDGYFVQKSDFGVIAQDVQKVFPMAVRTREDGTLAVDYEKLGTLAFAAIGQLLKRVEALEAK
jgi:hypothetical protein